MGYGKALSLRKIQLVSLKTLSDYHRIKEMHYNAAWLHRATQRHNKFRYNKSQCASYDNIMFPMIISGFDCIFMPSYYIICVYHQNVQ